MLRTRTYNADLHKTKATCYSKVKLSLYQVENHEKKNQFDADSMCAAILF